jgi:hypothetical protein
MFRPQVKLREEQKIDGCNAWALGWGVPGKTEWKCNCTFWWAKRLPVTYYGLTRKKDGFCYVYK